MTLVNGIPDTKIDVQTPDFGVAASWKDGPSGPKTIIFYHTIELSISPSAVGCIQGFKNFSV